MRGVVTLALVMIGLVAPPLPAQEAPLPADFTFKRVKVADRKVGDLITVQIDPAEQARLLAALPKVDPYPKPSAETPAPAPGDAPAARDQGQYAWFWTLVPPELAQRDGRFATALASLGKGPGSQSIPAPRMQVMQDMAKLYGADLLAATVGTRVSPALALAVISVESGGKPDAVSSAGATGLMQLIPATAKRFGVSDAKDPVQNIKGGVAYLDWLMGKFGGDPLMVLAAYNAGEGAVDKYQGVPPFAETRDYVPKVLAAWTVAQGLCATPPELVSDACVFKVILAGG